MAVLTTGQLAALRHECEAESPNVNYTKVQINAALQAIEDWLEANRASLAVVINTATAPFIFTPTQKILLAKMWMRSKFERGG